MAEQAWAVYPERDAPPNAVTSLAAEVAEDGGTALAIYREPVGGTWQIFALLPMDRVAPTPYQRDLSPAHAKRLQGVIKKLDRFVDPIVALRAGPGKYWTPNGRHRLAALEKLKGKYIPAILIPEPEVAFQILALNTEKAHNLKEKSLEVIRMYRGLLEAQGGRPEGDFAFQFEEPHFITLGLVYEQQARFSGSVFAPIVRRVDGFLKSSLTKSFPEREERAGLVRGADAVLTDVVARLKKRGIVHPYVKNFVIARCSPLTRARKTVPSFAQAFEKLRAALEKFDPSAVRVDEIARAAVFAGAE
jgi:ParB family chromosome partitioning protein